MDTSNTAVTTDVTAKRKKKILAAVYSLLLMTLSALMVAGAYILGSMQLDTYSGDEPARLIAFSDSKGNVTVISPDNAMRIELDEYGTVSDLKLSARGDRLFYIVYENESSILCSRKLSSLVYERRVHGEDVTSYILSRDGDALVCLTANGTLLYAGTDGEAYPKEIDTRVSGYCTSEGIEKIIYSAKREGGREHVYSFDGEASELLYENATILDSGEGPSSILLTSQGRLILLDGENGEGRVISESFGELIQSRDGVIYYTMRKDDGTQSLFCYDGEEKLVTDSLCDVVFTSKKPLIVYTELAEDGYTEEYKVLIGGHTESIETLSGSDYSDFAASEDGSLLFFNDASKKQEMLIRANVGESSLSSFSVIDTDTKHVCAIVGNKILYIKNFNPISSTADLYCNSERIHSGVNVNELIPFPDYVAPVRSYTWVHQGIVSTGYVCQRVQGVEAVVYNADGKVYFYAGKDEYPIGIGDAKDVLIISDDTAVYKGEDEMLILKDGRVSKKSYRADRFLHVKGYNEK